MMFEQTLPGSDGQATLVSSLASSDERDLGIRVQAGDVDAFAVLYERYASRLYDYVLRLVRQPAQAEDVVHSTFVKAIEQHATLRSPSSVRAWLFTIAHHLAINLLERTKGGDPIDDLIPLMDEQPEPEEVLLIHELTDLVWQAAASLERRQYAVLDLTLRQGFSTTEAAQIIGVSPAHMAVLVHRAHTALGNAVRLLLVARQREECPRLRDLLPLLRTPFSPEQRRTVDRHLRQCATCQQIAARLTTPEELFGTIMPLPLPPALAQHGWFHIMTQVHLATVPGTSGASVGGGKSSRTTQSLVAAATLLVILGLVARLATQQGTTTAPLHPAAATPVPLTPQSLLFLSTTDGTFAALRVRDGSILWQLHSRTPATVATTTDASTVYSLTTGSPPALTAHQIRDGALRWQVRLPASEHFAAPVVAAHTVYLVAQSHTGTAQVLAFATQDGTLRWRRTIGSFGHGPLAPPLLTGQRLIVGSRDDSIVALRLSDGRQLWRHADEPDVTPDADDVITPWAVSGDTLVAAVQGPPGTPALAQAWNVQTGQALWQAHVAFPIVSLGVSPPQVLIVGTHQFAVVSLSSGAAERTIALPVSLATTSLLPEQRLVGVTAEGVLAALRTSDGVLLWHAALHCAAYPPLVLNQTIYVSSRDGTLRAVRATDGRVLWSAHIGALAAPLDSGPAA